MDNWYYDVNIICIHHKIQIKARIPLKRGVLGAGKALGAPFPFLQSLIPEQEGATRNRDWALTDCQQILDCQFSEI